MKSRTSIVALSSGRLPAGVAVIRMSGPQTRFAVETICGVLPATRKATLRTFRDRNGSLLDQGIVLLFEAPSSFTGEDVAEFQLHGSRAVVSRFLEVLTGFDGVQMAEPGEFTRRAFANGKLDLVETEALADLVNAETEAQRRFALANAGGSQGALYQLWRQRLVHARAMVEAHIDFSDEGDVASLAEGIVWRDVATLRDEMWRHLSGFRAAEIIRDGFEVVILGAPNVGKSSLFNALARRDAAIVTDEPGTTRDLLEVSLDIGGYKVRVTDTAGLRSEAGRVEAIGIERARAKAASADLVLFLADLTRPAPPAPPPVECELWTVGTKLDLARDLPAAPRHLHCVSSVTGEGLDALTQAIGLKAADAASTSGEILPFRQRHVELLLRAADHLEGALSSYASELKAEELRLAGEALGRIVGAVDVEDLLDVIFSQFCIGK